MIRLTFAVFFKGQRVSTLFPLFLAPLREACWPNYRLSYAKRRKPEYAVWQEEACSSTIFSGIYNGICSGVDVMAPVKATFFLPLRDNDGRDLGEAINTVEEECFLLFGAWTMAGFFKGVWRMESGERQVDTSAAYMVVLDEDQLPELEALLKRFKAGTTQEAIFLEVVHDIDVRWL